MNYESDVACRVAQGNSILECWVPVRCPLGALWGWGSGVVKNFSPLKMSTFPPASISDLVSPGIVGCLGSVIWYPSSFWEKKNLQPRLSFSIPTFSNYLLSISPTRKQCPKNRCSDVGLETGLTSKMAHSEIFLTWRMLTLVWKLIPLTWKICLIWKKIDIAIGGLKALWLPGLTQHRFSSKLPLDLPC